MAARHRLPAGFHGVQFTRAVSGSALSGLRAARSALNGEGATPTVDEALAERERWRLRDEARRQPQGLLSLVVRQ